MRDRGAIDRERLTDRVSQGGAERRQPVSQGQQAPWRNGLPTDEEADDRCQLSGFDRLDLDRRRRTEIDGEADPRWSVTNLGQLTRAVKREVKAIGVEQVRQVLEPSPLIAVMAVAEDIGIGTLAWRLGLDMADEGRAVLDREIRTADSWLLCLTSKVDGGPSIEGC